jgi:histidinol-phosphate aminotransferase
MTLPTPRAGIMDIAPYVGGRSGVGGASKVIKLSSNESPLGPSPKAAAAIERIAGQVHRYPDGGSEDLRAALGDHYGLDAAQIVCANGSDEIFQLICRAYVGEGDEVLYTEHGFLMYPIVAKAAGATPVTAPEADLTANVDALLERVTARTKVVFLANPNNPTGTYLPQAEVARLRAGLPGGVLLVLDAAYAEYVLQNDYEAGIQLVDGGDNVMMTRTFSKIYGLAGLRLGWAYCPARVADILNRVRGPFNVTLPAQLAGIEALRDVGFMDRARSHNEQWREWLKDQLTAIGLEVVPSVANFLLVRFPGQAGKDAKSADAFLSSRGIIVRAMNAYGLPDCLRITIGLEDDNLAVLRTLTAFMAE